MLSTQIYMYLWESLSGHAQTGGKKTFCTLKNCTHMVPSNTVQRQYVNKKSAESERQLKEKLVLDFLLRLCHQ